MPSLASRTHDLTLAGGWSLRCRRASRKCPTNLLSSLRDGLAGRARSARAAPSSLGEPDHDRIQTSRSARRSRLHAVRPQLSTKRRLIGGLISCGSYSSDGAGHGRALFADARNASKVGSGALRRISTPGRTSIFTSSEGEITFLVGEEIKIRTARATSSSCPATRATAFRVDERDRGVPQ